MDQAGKYVADAVLGIDTLWGGDVMCPSGTGRFIADSWFSDEPLPAAYTHPAAARVRETGGVAGKKIDREAVEEYLRQVDLPKAIAGVRDEAGKLEGLRGSYLTGLAVSLDTMWDLAMEVLGKGDPVPYARSVEASTAKPPEPSRPEKKRERVSPSFLGRAGYAASNAGGLLEAVDAWRRERVVPMASVRALGAAVIAHFDNLSAKEAAAAPSHGTCAGAAGEHRLPADQGCLVFRLDELPGASAQCRRHSAVRSELRDQCFACRCRIRSLSSSSATKLFLGT